MAQANVAKANTDIHFYPRKLYHCRYLRPFLEKIYNEKCLQSIN